MDHKFLLSLGNFSASNLNNFFSLSTEYFIIEFGDGPVEEVISVLGLLAAGCAVWGGSMGGL